MHSVGAETKQTFNHARARKEAGVSTSTVSKGFVLLLGNILVPGPFAFSAMNVLWMLIFIVLVATVASVGPAWGAALVKIAQTLRYE
jgi:ABC-type lipoprotein release transport system permease subunit